MCQRRGIRFIDNLTRRRASVTDSRSRLGIPLLADRRRERRHGLVAKLLNHEIVIPDIPQSVADGGVIRYWPGMMIACTRNSFVHRTLDEMNGTFLPRICRDNIPLPAEEPPDNG